MLASSRFQQREGPCMGLLAPGIVKCRIVPLNALLDKHVVHILMGARGEAGLWNLFTAEPNVLVNIIPPRLDPDHCHCTTSRFWNWIDFLGTLTVSTSTKSRHRDEDIHYYYNTEREGSRVVYGRNIFSIKYKYFLDSTSFTLPLSVWPSCVSSFITRLYPYQWNEAIIFVNTSRV